MITRVNTAAVALVLALSGPLLAAPAAPVAVGTNTPPAITSNNWAVAMTRPGLPNLHKVSATLYRGAQPTANGFAELKKMGIKTVVCLRKLHSDKELLGSNGLAYVAIPMNTWHAEREDVVAFLKVVSDTNRTPVFVHCQHGSDRTGTMCAFYRMAVCGWSKTDALKEMTEGGFGFHGVWQNLLQFINKVDLAKVKDQAGLKPGGPCVGVRAVPQGRDRGIPEHN